MTDSARPSEPALAPEHMIGNIDYRVSVPPLSLRDYLRMQRMLLRSPDGPPERRVWWRLLPWVVIGGVIGWAASTYDLTAELWVAIEDSKLSWLFGSTGVIVLAIWLVFMGAAANMLYLYRLQQRLMRKLHAAGREMFGAYELLFGDGGVVLRNRGRSQIVPWSGITRVAPDQAVTFVVVDHISAFWLQDSVLAALPDRAGFLAYLEQRIASHRPSGQTTSDASFSPPSQSHNPQ